MANLSLATERVSRTAAKSAAQREARTLLRGRSMETASIDSTPLQRLLHRWFVQYNPLYLVSATLCLAGLRMISRGLAEKGTAFADLSVATITEIYAAALIGGAALLTRIGQRRPGVMLALIAALYQG